MDDSAPSVVGVCELSIRGALSWAHTHVASKYRWHEALHDSHGYAHKSYDVPHWSNTLGHRTSSDVEAALQIEADPTTSFGTWLHHARTYDKLSNLCVCKARKSMLHINKIGTVRLGY